MYKTQKFYFSEKYLPNSIRTRYHFYQKYSFLSTVREYGRAIEGVLDVASLQSIHSVEQMWSILQSNIARGVLLNDESLALTVRCRKQKGNVEKNISLSKIH